MSSNLSNKTLLVIAPDFFISESAASIRMYFFLKANAGQFKKVIYISPNNLASSSRMLSGLRSLPKNVNIIFVKSKFRLPYPLNKFFDLILFIKMVAYCIKTTSLEHIDLIFTSVPPFEIGLASVIISKLRRKNLIVDVRDDWERSKEIGLKRFFPESLLKLFRFCGLVIYRNAVALTAVSLLLKKYLSRVTKCRHVKLIPNGADTSLIKPIISPEKLKYIREREHLPKDKILLIYSGGVAHYHKIDLLFRAISLLPSNIANNAHFVFYLNIKDNKRFNKFENIIQQLKITNFVEIRKPINRERLAEILSASDIGLISLTTHEYFKYNRPVKLYEYASAGLFVFAIGPKNGELELLIRKYRLGEFISTSNPKIIAEKLIQVIENKSSLNQSARMQRHKIISENYDRLEVMKKMSKIFSRIL